MKRAPVDRQGEFVLYWMTANRRTTWNFSLQRSIEWTRQLLEAFAQTLRGAQET